MSGENDIHPELQAVFDRLKDHDVAITGSALRDFSKANDIDVIFPATVNYKDIVRRLGAEYKGGFDVTRSGEGNRDAVKGDHIRRATWRIPGVSKPIELIQRASVKKFEDCKHEVLCRDGVRHNVGKYYVKPPSNKANPALTDVLKKLKNR